MQESNGSSEFPYISWVPTTDDGLDCILEVADLTKDDVFCDLGCGDGRVVIGAAKNIGCRCVGIESSEGMYEHARNAVDRAGVERLVEIRHENIFTADLSGCTSAFMFLHPDVNEWIVPRLNRSVDLRTVIVQLYSNDMIDFLSRLSSTPISIVTWNASEDVPGRTWLAKFETPLIICESQTRGVRLDDLMSGKLDVANVQPKHLRELIIDAMRMTGSRDQVGGHNRHASCFSSRRDC